MQLTSTWFDLKCLMRVRVGLELVINIVIFSIAGVGWSRNRYMYHLDENKCVLTIIILNKLASTYVFLLMWMTLQHDQGVCFTFPWSP